MRLAVLALLMQTDGNSWVINESGRLTWCFSSLLGLPLLLLCLLLLLLVHVGQLLNV
jgi:hypothetical protein